jgi:hypothetical protein
MGYGRQRRYFLNLGGAVGNIGAIRWGFKAPKDIYKNIGSDLGVTEVADNNRTGIVYGCNQPRPVRVQIAYVSAQAGGGEANDIKRSVKRFCEPDNLNSVLFGSVNGKKVFVCDLDDGGGTEYDIDNVTIST